MTDPTVKKCPCGHVPDHPAFIGVKKLDGWKCDRCRDSGTVPLTTGELLEACVEKWEGVQLTVYHATAHIDTWQGPRFVGSAPDDALRAALRAVTE